MLDWRIGIDIGKSPGVESPCPGSCERRMTKHVDFWLGDSLGHWEGDTLVVDVTNFDARSWLDSARHTHSDGLHVVERYTLVSPGIIRYEATIEDPKIYTRRWKIGMHLHRNKEPGFELREQECTEGDDGRAIHPPYRPPGALYRWMAVRIPKTIWHGRRPSKIPKYSPERGR